MITYPHVFGAPLQTSVFTILYLKAMMGKKQRRYDNPLDPHTTIETEIVKPVYD
ncbi:hypothetical protein KKI24_00185 [bacterium]|nr:hypothetical protein [bacterium]